MSPFIKKLQLLERIDLLIRRRGTGSPKDLASRLEVSVRYIYKLLDYLRTMGAEIAFNHHRNSYEYLNANQFQFRIGLTGVNEAKIKGGQTFFQNFPSMHNLCIFHKYFCTIS